MHTWRRFSGQSKNR